MSEPPSPVASGRRTILHVDMDAFYASVEQHRRPELRGRPVVVGGSGRRGVVAAASYEARAFGIRSAMPSLRARTLCPDAVFIPGDHAHYAAVSARIMAIFSEVTPLVEPLSLDEAFLDATGARRRLGDGATIAHQVRARVLDTEGLTCSVGVATSKFLAKFATEKAKPSASVRGAVPGAGVVEIEPGRELAFLHPLPIGALWGVGPKTGDRLRRLGVQTVGDLAALPVAVVARAVGSGTAAHLHALAQGRDDRPVVPDAAPKSISHEETFVEDIDRRDALDLHVVRMADAVADRARRHDLPGRTVTIKVRFGDFDTITRSHTASRPLSTGPAIAAVARDLLDDVDHRRGIRLLGVGLTNLGAEPSEQLQLLDPAALSTAPTNAPDGTGTVVPESRSGRGAPSTRRAADVDRPEWRAVTEALDAVRERFGPDSLLPASLADGRRATNADEPRRPGRFVPGAQQWGPTAAAPDGGPGIDAGDRGGPGDAGEAGDGDAGGDSPGASTAG